MNLLKDKNVLVTGAFRGIGKKITRKFAESGANVAFTDIAPKESAADFEKELRDLGGKAVAYQSDASSMQEAEKLMEEIIAEFTTLDVVVNNAGITRDNLLLRMSEENWDDVININLKSVFNITKQAIKPMLKQRSGSIINISSVVGVSGNAGQANYSASKAGIIGFTKSIAQELGGRNIRCNAIAPGFIDTDMTKELMEDTKDQFLSDIPLNRFGLPEEVANTALFLASDLSSYVSGQVLNVCGGLNT